MNRKITLSIALIVSVILVSLMNSDQAANAAAPQRFSADTGIITLGPNQILRLTVTGETPAVAYRFRKMGYEPITQETGITRLAIASQNTSALITLESGEAASFEIPNTAFGVRGMVLSNSRDGKVTALIINTVTGEAVPKAVPFDIDPS